jgi:hypothetical protein
VWPKIKLHLLLCHFIIAKIQVQTGDNYVRPSFFGQNCSLPFSLRSLDIPALLKFWQKHCALIFVKSLYVTQHNFNKIYHVY